MSGELIDNDSWKEKQIKTLRAFQNPEVIMCWDAFQNLDFITR